MGLAELLQNSRGIVQEEWERAAARLPGRQELAPPWLRDTFPSLIDYLISALSPMDGSTPLPGTLVERHG